MQYGLGLSLTQLSGIIPINTVAPTITGTATSGSTLTEHDGTWVGSPSFTYLWRHSDGSSAAAAATSSTYVVASADAGFAMVVVVTGTVTGGYVQAAVSDATAIIPPVNTVAPTITGTAQVAQTLTGHNGTWTGGPTFTYLWKHGDNSAAAATATAITYVPVAGDVGFTMKLTVTGTNAGGDTSATTSATLAVIS